MYIFRVRRKFWLGPTSISLSPSAQITFWDQCYHLRNDISDLRKFAAESNVTIEQFTWLPGIWGSLFSSGLSIFLYFSKEAHNPWSYSTGNFRQKSKDLLSWFVVIMISQEIPIRKMYVSVASLFEFLAREIIQSFIWLLIDCRLYLWKFLKEFSIGWSHLMDFTSTTNLWFLSE